METILNYLDNIFMHCQQTPEVQRAKEDLAEMMEDKYNELTAQGKAKHEAIGIVISEFGNIQELAEELELKVSKPDSEPDEKRNSFDIPDKSEIQNEDTVKNKSDTEYNSFRSSKDTGIHLTEIDGAEYLFAVKQSSIQIAAGVFLCICSPALLILLSGIQYTMVSFSDRITSGAGVTVLLCMVACAVGLFINAGMKLNSYSYLKKECFTIDETYAQEIVQLRENRKDKFKVKITAGVMMCILSVVPLLISAALDGISDLPNILSVILLLIIVGIAVSFFITAGMEEESYAVLLQEKDFSVKKKSAKNITDIISSIYWPIIVIVYLASSFITGGWGYTWLIWPLAGILYQIICSIAEESVKKI